MTWAFAFTVRSCWTTRGDHDAIYEFDQSRIVIGRGRGADVQLPHRTVSVRHATIELDGPRYTITDHTSTNGTRVAGARIVPGRAKPLRDGDRVELGGFAITFHAGQPVTRTNTAEHTASLARRLAREALEADDPPLAPSVSVLNGPSAGFQRVLPRPPAKLAIGRDPQAAFALEDADLSRHHAEIEVLVDGIFVRDNESKNGVFVGTERVVRHLLADRDEITVGSTVLRFEDPAAAAVRALESGDDEERETPGAAAIAPDEPIAAAPDQAGSPAEESTTDDASASADPAADVRPASSPRTRDASIAPADMLIYVLASVIFALSVLGLIWLLRPFG